MNEVKQQVFRLVCQQCTEQGATPERIHDLGGVATLAFCSPFYDGNGRRHQHDTNRLTYDFRCSNGHQFSQMIPHTCWCGWVQEI